MHVKTGLRENTVRYLPRQHASALLHPIGQTKLLMGFLFPFVGTEVEVVAYKTKEKSYLAGNLPRLNIWGNTFIHFLSD